MTRKAGLLLGLVVAMAPLGVSSLGWCDRPLPFFDAKDLSPYWESELPQGKGDQRQAVPATVKPFHAIDQEGKAVSEKSFEGKVSLVNFFFAQCGSACPLMMSALQKVQRKLAAQDPGSRIRLFSFSVMPSHDSPAKLRAYAKNRAMKLGNWSLLTGDRDEIYRVGKEVFQADRAVGAQKGFSSFIHSSNVYLVDPRLRIRGIYDTQSAQQMRLLAQDVAKLEHGG